MASMGRVNTEYAGSETTHIGNTGGEGNSYLCIVGLQCHFSFHDDLLLPWAQCPEGLLS